MSFIKLQLGCFSLCLFFGFMYFYELGVKSKERRNPLFIAILICSIAWIFFDGLTAYTVNHLETVNHTLNLILHLFFMISIDTMVYLMFLYILSITDSFPKKNIQWIIFSLPYGLTIITLFLTIGSLDFIKGQTTNYSMGISAYTCYAIVALYFILTFFTFFRKWQYIEKRKRFSILVYTSVSLIVSVLQMIFPEILITAIAPTFFVMGIYLSYEEPAARKLEAYHKDTVVDFATLVENRDNNTGGHIKRTTAYVNLIVDELHERGYYKDLITKDFIKNMEMAAPMHDIGKISTPDAILQKPGKLTDEEFSIMKNHAENGSKIIQETFGKHGKEEFIQVAYQVSRFHHEKWNGKGYPLGLKETEIPLSARIMAIADVFDAVSQKRCYRDAMPLDQCFEIISKGREWDFDPLLVDIFLEIRPKVEAIYNQIS